MNKFAALRLPDTNARPTRDDSLCARRRSGAS